ncbi:MAG: hypothetical protein K8I03_16800, partial [Ignavibacteria bacterium]|nr:hypothetical protein [Ignavibacteria bacterium]
MANTNLTVGYSPVDDKLILLGNISQFRSTNAGANFSSSGFAYNDAHAIDFHPTNENVVFYGCDGGIFRSTDKGTNWFGLNGTLSLSEAYKLSVNPSNPDAIFIGVTDNGHLQKDNGTVNWTSRQSCCDGTNIVYSPFKSNVIVASTGAHYPSDNKFDPWYSTNSGLSFTSYNLPGLWDGHNDWVTPLFPHPNEPGIFYTARREASGSNNIVFWKSTNDGVSYNEVNPSSHIANNKAPLQIAVSKSNSDLIYLSSGSYPADIDQKLFRSTNGGVNWSVVQSFDDQIPDRYISHIEINPANEQEVFLTLSGYYYPSTSGHVWKSSNGGTNWSNISGTENVLPDIPVNDLVIHNTGCSSRDIIIATDLGVYVSSDEGQSWRELAQETLPNCIVTDLDFNLYSGKLRAATWGRGVWEVDAGGIVYVKGTEYLNSDPATSGLNVVNDIIVCSNGNLKIPYGCTIKMAAGKKIIVQSGGTIDASSGNAITFTSQSGTWGGIEFQGSGAGTLKNCTFLNTSTPIVIESEEGDVEYPEITIDECTFSNSPVQITNRAEVTIQNCDFTYSSGDAPTVLGVLSTGSDNVDISKNTVTSNSSITSAGISIVFGNSVSITENTIQNMGLGISLSNTDAFVENNTITATGDPGDNIGIGADNSYSCIINKNTVTDYFYGIKLYSSSPT